MKSFEKPETSLGDLKADVAAHLLASASDVALVVGENGTILDLAVGSNEIPAEACAAWVGRPWAETVAPDSIEKVGLFLGESGRTAEPRWRHINQVLPGGTGIPLLFVAIHMERPRRVLAFGRDLRATAALQQRLVEAQQSMEREYGRLRHAETRYRLLFDMTGEAVLIVEAASLRVVEANPAAAELLGETAARLVGRTLPLFFDMESAPVLQLRLARGSASGRPTEFETRLLEGGHRIRLSALLFRQEGAPLFLVRLAPLEGEVGAPMPIESKAHLLELVESGPDGFLVTNPTGRVISANAAFLDLAQLAAEDQAIGQSLDRWLGRPGVDLDVLIANLRQHGSVRLYATTLRGEYGAAVDIEVSAAAVTHADQLLFGFTIRNVGRRLSTESRVGRELPRSVEQLTELVGRVPLKDLIRETTDVIERLFIEAALELTGDNRASAAEILGLSRQSLYVKLRRYGLMDGVPEERG